MYGSGTSSLLRLTKPWSGSDCIVVADAAFASLKSAQALHNRRGLRFIGLVKTAHKQFTKARLQHHQYSECGEHCVMQETVEGRQYMAVGRKMKLFFASTSRTTDALNPAYKKRYRVSTAADRAEAPFVVYYKEVKRPAVVIEWAAYPDAIA